MVEKPLGHDLASARALNAELAKHFGEQQIYRIDHYLGKETVQNLMAIRFANALFEPLWNSHYVEQVQITVAESLGVAGRGAYYDKSGAMRDMVQNHMMQLLCLTAMEPPSKFDPDAVRDEKLKVIRALDPLKIERHGARAVPGERQGRELSRARGQPGEPDRELRGVPGAHRQLALVGDAVLPADRQEAVGAALRDLRGLQASAAHDLPAGRRAPGQRADHPAAAGRGHHAARGDQGSGAGGHAADRGAARHDLRPRARAGRGRDARGLRAADHGRDPRQPDAVHARRRGGGGLGVDRPDHPGLGGVGLAAAALRPGQRRADRRLQADRRATGTSGARSPHDRGGAAGLSRPGHADARPGGAGRRPAPRGARQQGARDAGGAGGHHAGAVPRRAVGGGSRLGGRAACCRPTSGWCRR